MFSAAGKSAVTSGYNINNSLRFRGSASAYLNRTPASAGNRKTFTLSTWVKRGLISGTRALLNVNQNSSYGMFQIGFSLDVDNDIGVYQNSSGTNVLRVTTAAVFRDPSAWYHVVVAVDTTQATAANRVKIYVNGVEQTINIGDQVALNTDLWCNNTMAHNIGKEQTAAGGSSGYFDGCMAEYHFIDGQALTPSSFGETNGGTGVWRPKKYVGSYGTNGFYLPFSDIATTSGSNAGLGKDFSGNSNYWTTNNISVTSGVTYDAMLDSPTNTSATVGNYAVLNPLDKSAGTVSNGNLAIVKGSTGAFANIRGTISVLSGKWYYETTLTSGINYSTIGILSPDVAFPSQIGDSAYGWDWYPAFAEKKNNTTSTSYGTTASAGDVIMCAFDVTNGKIWWGKNGTWFASGDPAAGTNAAFTNVTGTVAPAVAVSGTSTQIDVNFGQRPFAYTPPSGFVALNTFNLAESTIKKGSSYMDATTYTGTGATKTVTNAGAFYPDLVWVKVRSTTGTHVLTDSNRGANKQLFSNLTSAEGTATNKITGFTSTGFTLGADDGTGTGDANFNGSTYVAWQWRAGEGITTVNTSGAISSNVSVNATAGFSIVTYTGNGSNSTIGHGLGATPKMIIIRRRSGANWIVYHAHSNASPATGILYLNGTTAFGSSSTHFNNTAPTSSVFTVGTDTDTNENPFTYVAYCWAEIAGFSKFGSYTGNGSSDGPFVYTGFRPKFVLTKRISGVGDDWTLFDTARNTYNLATLLLRPNSNVAEQSSSIDILSNGFKWRQGGGNGNESSATYIYAAYAENPFKNALAR